MLRKRGIHGLLLFIAMGCMISCSTTRFVGEHEYLLDKVDVTVDNSQMKTSDLTPYLRQQPNFKVFGILKWPLYVYNWSGKSDKSWINKQFRKIGEAPELLDTNMVVQSQKELKRYMLNKGYADAEVSATIDTSKRKKAVVNYRIISHEPTRIGSYRTRVDDEQMNQLLQSKAQQPSWITNVIRTAHDGTTSLIHEGSLFDRDELDKERQRVTTLFRRHGYYAFNRDYIFFMVDSTEGKQKLVDVEMQIKPFRALSASADTVRDEPHRQYYINKVNIVTNYNPLRVEVGDRKSLPADSVFKRNIGIYYDEDKRSFRPTVLQSASYLTPGTLFNERNVEQTYSSFSNLQALRHVNIHFDEVEINDTMKLNSTILTTPERNQGIGFEVEGTNSAGDLGFASSMNYQHRNVFKGSELFSIKVRGAYESLSNNKEKVLGNYWELAGETSLRFPSFVFPFLSYNFKRKVRATTEFKLSYDQQRRPEYRRAILSGGWNYIWLNRSNTLARHTFKIVDINYVYLPYINHSFKQSLPITTALYNYSDQFIVSSGYTFSFNNYDPLKKNRNTYSFRASLELAGNGLYTLSSLLGAQEDDNGRYRLFGINYSQFVKGDLDFSRSIIVDKRNTLALHFGCGIGYPYGNSKELPFEKRYFSGGANSNRGWSVRSLGPGHMPIDESTTFFNQTGDIRIDANVEYRSKLFWKFELAAFIDAGNIWSIRSYEYQPGGDFSFTRLYKEIACSYGLGLRLDFDFFLVRFDAGLKAYNPQKEERDRWTIIHPNLTDNFAWHFAIGYPF